MTIPYSPCTAPEEGRLLPEYIADLLNDSDCEEVERHLSDCDSCKKHYLTVLRVRREAGVRRARMVAASQNGRAAAAGQSAGSAAFTSFDLTVERKGKI